VRLCLFGYFSVGFYLCKKKEIGWSGLGAVGQALTLTPGARLYPHPIFFPARLAPKFTSHFFFASRHSFTRFHRPHTYFRSSGIIPPDNTKKRSGSIQSVFRTLISAIAEDSDDAGVTNIKSDEISYR